MSEEPAKREDVRTTVSLHPTVNQWAQELMDARGYNNFSAMIADLIRQERDRVKTERESKPSHYRLNERLFKPARRKSKPLPPKP